MRTVFFDVDTQIDFFFPAGALYVPGAEKIAGRIGALNHWAESEFFTVVSTMDAHAENDPEFQDWPAHCVAGTVGQSKPLVTLLEKRIVIPSSLKQVKLCGARQVLLEKQTTDCFANANVHRLLDILAADRFVVYGVVTEICVRNAAFGLLQTGKPVELVTDAVECLNRDKAARMLAEFQARGGKLTTVSEVMQAA